jgi:hypothetical protein
LEKIEVVQPRQIKEVAGYDAGSHYDSLRSIYGCLNHSLGPVISFATSLHATAAQVTPIPEGPTADHQPIATALIAIGSSPGQTVWLVSELGYRHAIPFSTFRAKGWDFNLVQHLSVAEVNAYPEGASLLAADGSHVDTGPNTPLTPQQIGALPNGETVAASFAGTAYVIDDGHKRPIPGRAFEPAGFEWERMLQLSQTQLNSIPNGPPSTQPSIASGLVAIGNSPGQTVWQVSELGFRRAIPFSTFQVMGWDFNRVEHLAPADFSTRFPFEGAPLPAANNPAAGGGPPCCKYTWQCNSPCEPPQTCSTLQCPCNH